MTEEQWLKTRAHAQGLVWNLRSMTQVTRTKRGKRKLRLFACGCCRLIWERLRDPRLRKAVEVAERFAEGETDKDELEAVRCLVTPFRMGRYFPEKPDVLDLIAIDLAVATTHQQAFEAAFSMTVYEFPLAGYRTAQSDGEAVLCDLLRCVIGNPFRPVAFDSAWRTPSAFALARTAYEERRFEDLPLLADALEEAGCTDEAILTHCRGPGPHVRGCWVVDLVLGRS
jgi:hypothetical protein